jgi:hypothetical protein
MQQLVLENNFIEIFKGIHVYNNSEDVSLIVDRLEDLLLNFSEPGWQQAKIINSESKGYVVDKSLRSNLYFSLNLSLKYPDLIIKKMEYIDALINKSIFKPLKNYENKFAIKITKKDYHEVLKYREGDHLSSHTDDNGGNKPRVSLLFYLNDDYQGGEICFDFIDIKYSPKKGDIIIFPSSYIYRHHVEKVTNGTRYCIADFMS